MLLTRTVDADKLNLHVTHQRLTRALYRVGQFYHLVDE